MSTQLSNAESGSNMSNSQAGTRLTSSSDWTRLKKLRAILNMGSNNRGSGKSTNSVMYGKPLLIPKTTGASRYQNLASDRTNYIAAAKMDFITQSKNTAYSPAKTQTRTVFCASCASNTLTTRIGLCITCKHSRSRT